MYPVVQQRLTELGHFGEGCKLGNTGNPRKFFFLDANQKGHVFYAIRIHPDRTATLERKYDKMELFGISKEVADAMADEAIANAIRQKQ